MRSDGKVQHGTVAKISSRTATPIPTPNDRSWSAAQAGPVSFTVKGDWTRWEDYFGLALDTSARRSVTTVTFDVAATGLAWSTNPTRFYIGGSNGVAMGDTTHSTSADGKVFTITFAPGKFRGGESFRFGMSLFNALQGSTQLDPDRLRGMRVTANLDDGSTYTALVRADEKQAINRFTGAGLVNAAAATRAAQGR